MQDNNEIYQFMKANSLTDKDEKTFLNEYSNPQKAKELYSFFQANKLTDKDETSFYDTYLKKEPLQSLATKLPSPNQPINPLQQGANIVGGGVISDISAKVPKGSIKEAALADKKKNQSYLGALWNNAVGSVARLAGGAARATYQLSGNPVIQMERELLDRAGKVMGKNLLAEKEKEYTDAVKGVIEKGRTSASSKEYERKIAEGFDVTDGLGFSDLKGAVAMIPQFVSDMGLAAATGGGSFAIQGYDDALSMVDEIPEGSNISEGTRVAFGLGGAAVVGLLEKLGFDNLIKSPSAKKYVTAKILKEATDELVKKGVKVTADQFEKTVIDKASKLTRKELTKIVASRAAKSAAVEGGTEAIQEGGMDLLKLAANKIEGKEIFDEEEMKDTAAKRYLNSLAAGGILGGLGSSVIARVQNTEKAIKSKLSEAKTIEDIDGIVAEINDNVADGTMTQEEADNVLPIVENFVEVSQKVPETLSGKNKVQAVDLINEREKLGEQLKDIEAQKAAIDPSFHPLYDGDAEQIQERVNEINKELGELAKPENNIIEEAQPQEEVVVEELEAPKVKGAEPEISQPIELSPELPIKERDYTLKFDGNYVDNKSSHIDTAKKILKDLGVDAEFLSYSDTNGVSIYFNDKNTGKKIRISDHSVTSKNRMENEVLLSFDQVYMNGGIKSNFESNKKTVEEYLGEQSKLAQEIEPKEQPIKEQKEFAQKDLDRASGKENGNEKAEVNKQPIREAEAKPTKVEDKKEPKKISDKAREQAAKLRSGEANVLPEWLRANLPKGTKKQGIDINEAFANALETFADAYDKLKDFKAAAEKAFKNISDWYSENNIEYNEKELKEKFEDTLLKIQEGKREKERGTLRMDNKSILNRIYESENISQSVKDKLKDKLKYQVASQEEARKLAKEIIGEFGYEDGVTLAEAGKFSGDVNSMIFAEAIDNAFNNEAKAKTLEDKLKYAEEWKDIVERYDESARDKGRFISAIQDFYKKSPLGIIMLEESKRKERFEDWYKPKEKTLKEVFEAIKEEPEFKELIQKQVQEELKKERAENRKARRSKIEKFFDDAKFKGDALYAVPIPPKVINSGLELMKQAFLAGESVVNSVEVAIDYITKEVGTWDRDKFRKEYEEKLAALESKQKGKTDEELTQEKKDRILEKFRNKLKGLSESEKEEVIRKAFKKLVENGALEYQDFKDIIAETLGYGKMTEEEAKRITELVNDINSVETIAEEIRQDGNRTIENLKKYKEAKRKAEKSATELAALVYNKPNILKRLLSIMQLNTLGIPSLVNNPLFNIFNQATVRLPIGVQLTALDQIIYGASKIGSKLFGTSVIYPENNIIVSQGEFFRKAAEGAKESGNQLINGLTSRDYFQKEVYASQIQPFTSAKDLWDWKFNGKKLTPSQITDKTIQATVGLPAEVVARLLNIGDKPQRYAAEGAKSSVLAREFGLKDVDYEYFLEFPKEEAYRYYKQQGMSDESAMAKAEKSKEAIVKAGDESVFQQDNFLNDVINGAFEAAKKYNQGVYAFGQAVKMFNFPYLKIPLNAFWSVYNLVNPEVAFLQSAIYSIRAIKTKDRADIQKAKLWAAHGTTGMGLLAIAGGLVAKGIVNADNDDETTKKERMGEKQYEQQKSINVTKLSALLQGKDPDSIKHGLNVDLKYFGNMGSILNTIAIRQENMTEEQKQAGADYLNTLFSNLSQSSLELIDNGVFSNASSLITAFDRGGNYMDNYLLNLMNMGMNIVQPAMFAQHSRAQLPYYSKVKADTFYEEVKNNILARSSVARALTDKYPPSQIGIWGDKLERKDDLILKWFGMSKVDKNNFAQPIYEDYKKTKNTKFLPSSIKPEIDKQKLTVGETERLEILVGNARKALVAPYVNDLAKFEGLDKKYSELSVDQKIKVLNILYDLGYQKGKNLFLESNPKYKKPEEELNIDKITEDAYMQIFKIIKETE